MRCPPRLLLISLVLSYLGEQHGGAVHGFQAVSVRLSSHASGPCCRQSSWTVATNQGFLQSVNRCSSLSLPCKVGPSLLPTSNYHKAHYPSTRILRSSIAGREGDEDNDIVDPQRYAKALKNTALAIGSAVLFGVGINHFMGSDLALQYFAGYVVEQSLSVDNLFVFLLLFDFFKVPLEYQNRVLSWGIIGAVIMRGIFIALGEAAIESFQGVLLVFAGILLYSSFSLFFEGEEEEEDLADNFIVKFATKYLDATETYDGDRFFTIVDGVKKATPLLLVLACVELSDVVFAVDSIPAVFGVTTNPFIVYTSNIFAILNLRSMYTVLANAMGDLPYLKPSVAIVLGFVGGKLGAEYFGYDMSTALSLAFIATTLAGGVIMSLVSTSEEADAGSDDVA